MGLMTRGLLLMGALSLMVACGEDEAKKKAAPNDPSRERANVEPESGSETPPTVPDNPRRKLANEAPESGSETPPTVPDNPRRELANEAPESGSETPPTVPDDPRRKLANVTPPAPKRVTASVGDMLPDPETPLGTVDVAFTLPPGWGEETAWGKNHWGPDGGDLAFSFDTTCNGNCHPAKIAGNLARAFEGFEDSAARPNVNSGDPAKDAIRATVETVAAEATDHLRLAALKVTYSDEVLASGPYRPQLRVLCAWHTPGDAWYLTLSLRAELKAGEAILPNVLDVCRSVEVKGPTPNAAQQQEALVIEGTGCALAGIPEAAYTVESKNSKGQPSVILLTRPIVVGGLPLAPIGRVYVEYNDDPITLRDVFTAEDRLFEVEGVEITCLRRQPLRIDGSCAVRRCVLARETTLGDRTAPAYSEVTFGTGSDGEASFKRIVPPKW